MVLATDSIHNIFTTSKDNGLGLGANSNIKAFRGEIKSVTIGSGVLTLNTTTANYGIDFVDVHINSGDLEAGDFLMVEAMTNNSSDKISSIRLSIKNTTTEQDGPTLVIAGNGSPGFMWCRFNQDPSASDKLIGLIMSNDGSTLSGSGGVYDTDDQNILTTSFTIRVSAKYAAQPASAATKIRFIIYAIKGV